MAALDACALEGESRMSIDAVTPGCWPSAAAAGSLHILAAPGGRRVYEWSNRLWYSIRPLTGARFGDTPEEMHALGWRYENEVPKPNATFVAFKPSGKFYQIARGHLPRDAFHPYYDRGRARQLILDAHAGAMPGLSSDGLGYHIVVTPDVDGPGWPISLPPEDGSWFDLVAHLRRQKNFSERTFGPGARTGGVIDHIRKELAEIEAAPSDLKEWVDIILLALDGAWRAGHAPETICAAIAAKQEINENRKWPDWRTQPADTAIEHVRDEAA